MNDELIDLIIRINNSVNDIHELTQDIKQMDKFIIDSQHDIISEEEAHEQMREIIEQYKKEVDKAKILLECLFKEEEKVNKPTDLLYRRLYKKLQEAY